MIDDASGMQTISGPTVDLPEVGSMAFFQAIVDTAANPYVVIDDNFILTYASPSIELLLGWKPQDWIGRSIAELLTPDSLELAASGLAEIELASRDPNWVGAPIRLFLVSSDHELVPVDAYARETSRTGVGGTLVQLVRAGAAQTMADAVDTILEGHDHDDALRLLTSLTEHNITETAVMLGTGWTGTDFTKVAGRDRLLFLTALDPVDRRSIEQVLTSGRHVADIFDDLAPKTRSAAIKRGWKACWCAPVPSDDEDTPSAAIFIWRRDPGPPGVIFRDDIKRSVNLTRLALHWMGHQRLLVWTASHDQLTGLANRAHFQNELDATAGKPRAVLFCDLDDFKPVNENIGHRAGDRVLTAVAKRMRAVCDACTVARMGGDEFAVLQHSILTADEALTVADRIQEVLAEPIALDDHLIEIGVTIGIAFDPTGGADSDHLIDEADRLLLDGKASGKNQIRCTTVTS